MPTTRNSPYILLWHHNHRAAKPKMWNLEDQRRNRHRLGLVIRQVGLLGRRQNRGWSTGGGERLPVEGRVYRWNGGWTGAGEGLQMEGRGYRLRGGATGVQVAEWGQGWGSGTVLGGGCKNRADRVLRTENVKRTTWMKESGKWFFIFPRIFVWMTNAWFKFLKTKNKTRGKVKLNLKKRASD